ncbi:MAG: hypothetical protein ACI87E_001413, partial [Mariniblastus sp.]
QGILGRRHRNGEGLGVGRQGKLDLVLRCFFSLRDDRLRGLDLREIGGADKTSDQQTKQRVCFDRHFKTQVIARMISEADSVADADRGHECGLGTIV